MERPHPLTLVLSNAVFLTFFLVSRFNLYESASLGKRRISFVNSVVVVCVVHRYLKACKTPASYRVGYSATPLSCSGARKEALALELYGRAANRAVAILRANEPRCGGPNETERLLA